MEPPPLLIVLGTVFFLSRGKFACGTCGTKPSREVTGGNGTQQSSGTGFSPQELFPRGNCCNTTTGVHGIETPTILGNDAQELLGHFSFGNCGSSHHGSAREWNPNKSSGTLFFLPGIFLMLGTRTHSSGNSDLYCPGRQYKDRLDMIMNIKRCLY